jgi:hypothetical protein
VEQRTPGLDAVLRELFGVRASNIAAELLALGASDDPVHVAIRLALTRSIADVVCSASEERIARDDEPIA